MPSPPAAPDWSPTTPTFPLPDWLAPLDRRPLIHIGAFRASVPPPSIVPHPTFRTDVKHEDALLYSNSREEEMEPHSEQYDYDANLHLPHLEHTEQLPQRSLTYSFLSTALAALQNASTGQPTRDWHSDLPTLDEILATANHHPSNTSLPSEETHAHPPAIISTTADVPSTLCRTFPDPNGCPHVFVDVAVYDAEAPTKSMHLRLHADSPLTLLIDSVKCTARAGLDGALCESPSTALVVLNGVIYADHRYDSTDYETHVAAYMRQNVFHRHQRQAATQPHQQQHQHPQHLSRSACPGSVPAVPIVQLGQANVTIADLTVRLGQPYLFLHNGDCEHALVFTDVFHDVQAPELEDAPLVQVTWSRGMRVIPCDVCKVRMAVKYALDDNLADESPFHYCTECFEMAHYSRDGGKLFEYSRRLVTHDHPETM